MALKLRPNDNIKCLVLLGGRSARMGTDKGLLVYKGQALYQRAIDVLRSSGYPVFMSIREEQLYQYETPLATPLFDELTNIGPAAAFLAAHKFDTCAHWLVVACDYPCIEPDSVLQLIEAHSSGNHTVTSFCSNLTPEPVFAIWSPDALDLLSQNVQRGIYGPIYTLKQVLIHGQMILPRQPKWLINTNTPEEFDSLLRKSDNHDV